jgi:prepilin-type N-terminal cleavage/methylation domain-containing protein
MSKRGGFTLIEMLVAVSIFSVIFGLCAAIYVHASWRVANAVAMNRMLYQVQYLDKFLENTIQNANTCTMVTYGSTSVLKCTMPQTGSPTDDNEVYNAYTPISVSNTTGVHWGQGKRRWFYPSDSTGNYNSGLLGILGGGPTGNKLFMAEVSNDSNPSGGGSDAITKFTFYNSNTSNYRWYLIDTWTVSVNSSNHSVTYTIGASDLTRGDTAVGASSDTAGSHTYSITRTVYWRNSTT